MGLQASYRRPNSFSISEWPSFTKVDAQSQLMRSAKMPPS
jgi:hypothetical protein